MKHNHSAFYRRLQTIHPLKLCLFVLVTDLLVTFLFSVILFPEPQYGNDMRSYALWEQVLLLLIAAPLAETYIFQRLFLEGMIRLTRQIGLSVFLIALLFGAAHHYSVPYMVKAFIAGLLYCALYLITKQKGKYAYWYTAGTHFVFNLVGILLNAFAAI